MRSQGLSYGLVIVEHADSRADELRHPYRRGVARADVPKGAMLHQRFTTEGIAPSRTSGGALFGAGGSIGVGLGRGAVLSLATELTSFVLRRDAPGGDAMDTHWDSTLSLGAVLAVGVER